MANRKAWAGLAALALIVSACERKPEPAPAPKPVAAAPTAPPPPLNYGRKTADAEVSLTLPAAVARVPALYAKLFADGRNSLDAFADGAKGDLDEQRAGGEAAAPYRRTMTYTVDAQTARLVGLHLAATEDTGGAHPSDTWKGLIWDKAASREVKISDLFPAGTDMAAADKALCDAIHGAKKVRRGDPALTGDLTACPRLTAASLTLAPSAVAGKAGGVIALFAPFALSGGGDSGYRIAVPLEAIRSVLAPAYAGEFAGAPAPGAADPAG